MSSGMPRCGQTPVGGNALWSFSIGISDRRQKTKPFGPLMAVVHPKCVKSMLRVEALIEEPTGLSYGIGKRRRVLPNIEVRRTRRIKSVPGAGIGLHLQHVPLCLNRIAPFGATGRRGDNRRHRRLGSACRFRAAGWAGRVGHNRGKRRRRRRKPVRSAGGRARQSLPSAPPTRHASRSPQPAEHAPGRGAQIGGTRSPRLHTS